ELKRLHHETGATFVYVTHDQLEAMTLATKICLLDRGYLQQYDPPLTVYNRPRNTFVADFVGNPTMNLISFSGERKDDHSCILHHKDMRLQFTSQDVLPEDLGKVTIGVRPENVLVTENGGIKVKVDTSLPSGMETILNLRLGDDVMLSCVMIGSVDYPSDSEIEVVFKDDQVLMFDGQGNFAAPGSVKFI
ncbi:MAG: ABC transporter ATP-binding protein, partial [Spirochaetales bacterium]|nr:ABC transporter ATP-binding protein [Spirochaetales bacterium]